MINENRLRQLAKKLKTELGITHTQALNVIAQNFGFPDWPAVMAELKAQAINGIEFPAISNEFVETGEVEMSESDYVLLETERIEDLPYEVKQRVRANMVALTKRGIEYSIFEPTKTGLLKSILDATQSVRAHFAIEEFHFYAEQVQGEIRREPSYFVDQNEVRESIGSFYRPRTKLGDPRMWFRSLGRFASAGDQIAIIILEKKPHLLNLSRFDLEQVLENSLNPISRFINSYVEARSGRARELLEKLRVLASSPIKALREGDTGLGYTVETLLGIQANSSKQPDYFGIEIKAGRGEANRTTLFAQVPDWSISPCGQPSGNNEKGSSAKILYKYGYQRGDDFKLYCTVSTQRQNSQGLHFIYNKSKDQLEEWFENSELVAVWPADTLRARLQEKHAETFWIKAKSIKKVDGEYFQLVEVVHTKSPILTQLVPLLVSGLVTMDHLIKKSGETGKVSEKGPLFKINKRDLELLFPAPVVYSLAP
jgi:hypothetical protein